MLRRIILYAVYVVLIAGLVVAIVLAFRTPKLSEPANHSGSQAVKPPASNSPKQSSSAGGSSAGKGSGSQTPASGSSVTAGQGGTANAGSGSQGLTNTGPGDVWAVFAVGTLAGGLVYRRYQLRKLN